MVVGEKIKTLRENWGLKQGALAKSLEIPQSHLSAVEGGTKEVTLKIVTNLKKKHGVSIDWLLDDTKDFTSLNMSDFVNYKPSGKTIESNESVELLFELLKPHEQSFNVLNQLKNSMHGDEALKLERFIEQITPTELKTAFDNIIDLHEELQNIQDYLNLIGIKPYIDFKIKTTQFFINKSGQEDINSVTKQAKEDFAQTLILIKDLKSLLAKASKLINRKVTG